MHAEYVHRRLGQGWRMPYRVAAIQPTPQDLRRFFKDRPGSFRTASGPVATSDAECALLIEVTDGDGDVIVHALTDICHSCSDRALCHQTMTDVLLIVQHALVDSGAVPRGDVAWYESDEDDWVAELRFTAKSIARAHIS